jgi:undecaprenyl diphosphate synthase
MPPKLHIAIIPDGNRRWAKSHALKAWNGHEKAMQNFTNLLQWAKDDGRTKVLTIWCFSTENWKRSEEEVAQLMRLFEEYLDREEAALMKNNTRLLHSGRKDRLPESLRKKIESVSERTKANDDMILHLAIDYGGKDEVLRAMKKITTGEEVTEDVLRSHLDQPELPDLDLIIRSMSCSKRAGIFSGNSSAVRV